jgi:hypothetical protein
MLSIRSGHQNPRLPISAAVAAMQTSLHFGLTQRPEVLVDFLRYLLFGLPTPIQHPLGSLPVSQGG